MKHRRFVALVFFFTLLFSSLLGCGQPSLSVPDNQTTPTFAPTSNFTIWPHQNWQVSSPEQQGMDSTRLADMLAYIQEKNIRMHSILVVRNGHLVFEAYYNPYDSQTYHQIASITKSVLGALIGIDIEKGDIESVNQPVLTYFPEREISNLDARKLSLTLEHLLMLAPGFDCSDIQGTEGQMFQSPDWAQFVLDLPMVAEPGKEWSYCSSAVHLVSAILQEATGMDARSYANRYLFPSIGISEVPPERWPSDPAGISTGGHGLLLTPREVARFAYLYLNGGRWENQQVVPENWVSQSIKPHIHVGRLKEYGDMDRSYGYLWSLYPDEKFYSALGRNGQHIHLFPEANLLVIFTSATRVFTDEAQFSLLTESILPAIQSDEALPENPAGLERLEAALEEAARPLRPVSELPAAAKTLDGKSIRIDENPFGWQEMTFDFEEGESTAEIHFDNGIQIKIGLDNLYRVQEMPGTGQVGFRGAWRRPDQFSVQQVILGTWAEHEINLTVDGDQVILFQRNVVDGGDLVRITGQIQN